MLFHLPFDAVELSNFFKFILQGRQFFLNFRVTAGGDNFVGFIQSSCSLVIVLELINFNLEIYFM